MGTLGQKLDYLTDTKSILKQKINNLGGSLTDESTFRSYGDYLDELYNEMPKVTGEGTEITLTPTRKGRMQLDLKGNTSQESTTGKNLLKIDTNFPDVNKRGITNIYDSNTGKNSFSGTATGDYPWISSVEINTIPQGTTLTFSISKTLTYKVYARLYYDGTNYETMTIDVRATNVSKTMQHDITRVVILLQVLTGETINDEIYLQIEQGSSATDFEIFTNGQPSPNPDYPQPIHVVTGNNTIGVQGINLIPNILTSKEINGITFTINPDKSVTINGTASATTQINLLTNTTGEADEITLPAGTYTLQGCPTGGSSSSYKLDITNNGSAVITDYGNNVYSRTFTDNWAFDRVRIVVQSGTTVSNLTFKPMLVKGNTNVPYVPYVEPQNYPINLGSLELCKIGDYQDYIYKENGNWYKQGAINKSVLNGTEANWSLSDGVIVCQAISNYAISNNIPIINSFIGVINKNNGSTLLNNEACFNNNLNYNRFYLKSDKFGSIADFKTWLSTNNLIVYCIARNVATTQITDETLISQLDAIENAMSTTETTTITQTNSDLPFIISASALKPFTTETLTTSLTDGE